MMDGDIELYIDELVLHGIAPGDSYRVGMQIQAELTRLLQMYGLPPALSSESDFAEINGGQFSVPLNFRPSAIGNQIAGSVFKGLQRTHQPLTNTGI